MRIGTSLLYQTFKTSTNYRDRLWKSFKVINEAFSLNSRDGINNASYVIVDPYCGFAGDDLDFCTDIIKDRVEALPLAFFSSLSANDILFIDSSHVCKAGSDVNFLILEVLQTLPINVYIHFHDIPMPFEYDRKYFTESDFRVFWNESYLLEAFLKFNSQFEIAMPMAFLKPSICQCFSICFPS